MNNRELKLFHNENRTHVTKKEFSGAEISVNNAVNASMDLKIFGNSYQKVTEQGKNLLDITKYKVQNQPKFTLNDGVLDLIYYTWTHHLYYEIKGLTPSAKYTFSLVANRQAQLDYDDKTHTNEWLAATTKNADGTYSAVQTMTAKADGSLIIRFRYGQDDPVFYCKAWDLMLEPGSSKTTFEPFVPNSPSKKYPSPIYSSKEMLLKSVGIKALSTKIPIVGNVMEVTDFAKSNLTVDGKYYLADYIEYNSATNKAYRHKFIDETLFDNTLPIKDQIQVILEEPIVEEITPSEAEYLFKDVKSAQDGCAISVNRYGTDDLPIPVPIHMVAKIKVVKKSVESVSGTYTVKDLVAGITSELTPTLLYSIAFDEYAVTINNKEYVRANAGESVRIATELLYSDNMRIVFYSSGEEIIRTRPEIVTSSSGFLIKE